MFWRRRRGADNFSDEVRAHLEHEEAQLRAAGMSPDDARAEARRRFGNPTRAVEDVRDVGPLRLLETLWQDVTFGVRLMRRSPAFSITAIVVLALGIGVNTALFSIVNALFFKPLPVRAPEELFYLYTKNEAGQVMASLAAFDYFYQRAPDLADYTGHSRQPLRLTVDDETEFVAGETVRSNYFDLLGVPALLGRTLDESDDDPATTEVAVVISHELWMRKFRGDPGVVGRRVRLNAVHATVAGVAAPGFEGLSDPFSPTQLWVAGAQMYRAEGDPWTPFTGGPIGRLRPGVTIEQVRSFFAVTLPEWKQGRIDRLRTQVTADRYERLRQSTQAIQILVYRAVDTRMPFNPERSLIPPAMLAGLVTVVALVLLIAAANIAGLLLARGVTRTGEVAVRRALGAGGARVTRQLLTESVLLALLGGALGLAVSTTLVGLFRAYTPSRFAVDVAVDIRVLLFAVGVCVGAGIFVGLAPALQAARVNVLEALGSGIVGARVVRSRLRYWIVMPQVALSLVLLLVAAVHVRALLAIEMTELGYRTDGSIVFSYGRWEPEPSLMSLRGRTREQAQEHEAREAAKIRAFNRAVLQRVAAVPGIGAYGIAVGLPVHPLFSGLEMPELITQEAYNAGRAPETRGIQAIVSDGYFEAMGMRVVRGRTFDERDGPYEAFGPRVAVVSESIARRLWPTGDALGQVFAFLPGAAGQQIAWLNVIGVVNDVEPVLGDPVEHPRVYVSLIQQWRGGYWPSLVVRGAADQAQLIRDVKAAVVGADAFAEVSRVQAMEQIVGEILYPRRLAASILAAAGLIGLLLASIGLYGVMSYSIAQRMREIGIRATLGADRRDILGLVLREGATIAASATAAGFVVALLTLRATSRLLPDSPSVDLLSFVAVPAALTAIIGVACLIPARRAARVDPASVLRT